MAEHKNYRDQNFWWTIQLPLERPPTFSGAPFVRRRNPHCASAFHPLQTVSAGVMYPTGSRATIGGPPVAVPGGGEVGSVKALIAIAVMLAGSSSCGVLESDSFEAPQLDPFELPPVEAEFRGHARVMYESLRKPSCQAPPGFDRATRLNEEYRAVRAFERQTQATPAQFHLEIASADAAFEQARSEGCWSDTDLVWANSHVEMTRRHVRASLDRLRAMASSLDRDPNRLAVPSEAPEFRYLVRQLVRSARQQCQITTLAGNSEVMATAWAEIDRFRASLEGGPFAAHFDIARQDVAYELSITMVECADPPRTELAEARQAAAASVGAALAGIRRWLQVR
jgi:hypothetical protein